MLSSLGRLADDRPAARDRAATRRVEASRLEVRASLPSGGAMEPASAAALEWAHAGTARTASAEDAHRALRERRPARRLARALAPFGPRPVAGHHPQRDGRPRGDGLHREPAHLRGARPHAQGLSLLRRQPDGDEGARARGDPSPRGRARGRPAARAREHGGGTALAAHAVRGRGDDAAPARSRVPPPRVPAPGRAARAADPRDGRRRRAEPHPAHRPLVHAVAAHRGHELLQPELRRPVVRHHPQPHQRRAARAAGRHRPSS